MTDLSFFPLKRFFSQIEDPKHITCEPFLKLVKTKQHVEKIAVDCATAYVTKSFEPLMREELQKEDLTHKCEEETVNARLMSVAPPQRPTENQSSFLF